MKRFWILTAGLLLTITSIQLDAQSYGHTNYGNILTSLDEVKAADNQLSTLRENLTVDFQQEVEAFKAKFDAASNRINAGELSPVEIQTLQTSLEEENKQLGLREQEIQRQILQKREELLKPIVDKLNAAIEKVAKDKGLQMIFDVSVGGLLFTKDSQDVTKEVLAEMGLQ